MERGQIYIFDRARFHSSIILDGRSITPSKQLTNSPTSIVQLDINGVRHVGQVFAIFSHQQPGISDISTWFNVRWFVRLRDANIMHWEP
jgi:hypothetical protein